MKKRYLLTIQQLHDAIQNTIRVYNDYKMDRKVHANSAYRVYGPGYYLQFQYFKTNDGCEIKTISGKASLSGKGEIKEENARANVMEFYRRIDQIVNKEVALTPDILNRDVYKAGAGLIAGVNLIRLVVAVIAIVIALMALLH